jgi:ATP-dependent helicase/nuclease subunit A
MKPLESYTIDGRAVPSERFYEVACNPHRHVVVEACAGAGKTWMLVSRMLRALLDGADPQQILAITFTKKAAGEMRARLLEWLEELPVLGDEKLKVEMRIRGLPDVHVADFRQQLHSLNLRLMRSPRPVQIRTFHSWFAQLTRCAPIGLRHALGLPGSYELLEDDSQIVEAVWPRFWAAIQASTELSEAYSASVASIGRSNTQAALAAALNHRAELAAASQEVLQQLSVPHFTQVFAGLQGLAHPDDWFLLPESQDLIRSAARALGHGTAQTPQRDAAELERLITQGRWAEADSVLLTDKGTMPARPATAGMTDGHKQTLQLAREHCVLVVKARIQHLAWLHQQRMLTLSRVLIEMFAGVKRERGWVDMGDIEQVALHLLNDETMGAWLQEVLDWRIRHLLIDEFQDTNPLQWQVLSGWLQSYAGQPAQAPSVFIVGDPKQSIYRFRRADPQVFAAAKVFVQEGLQGQWLACDHTRRNARAIIGLTNAVMQKATDDHEMSGFRAHSTQSDEAGEILVLPLVVMQADAADRTPPGHWRDSLTVPRVQPDEHVRQLEARQAAQALAGWVHSGESPGEIMVLARKNAQLARMEQELRALGVPCVRADQDSLLDSPEVQDIVALLECLLQPANDLALARALKSPVFGLDDAALATIALTVKAGQTGQDVQAMQGGMSWRMAIDQLGLQDHTGRVLAAVLQRWQSWLSQWPVHDALSHMMDEGQILRRYAQCVPEAMHGRVQANLQSMVNAALQVGGGRFVSARRLLRSLKDGRVKAPATTQTGAVRLLTIHKAKGLEANTVLLLDTMPSRDKVKGYRVLLDWPATLPGPKQLAFVTSAGNPAQSLQDLVSEDQCLDAREDLHCLYVAMTRAKRRLVISANQGKQVNPDASWYTRLMQTGLLQSIESLREPSLRPESAQRVFDALPDLCLASSTEGLPMQAKEGDAVSDLHARRGMALHLLLQSIPLHDGVDIPPPSAVDVQAAMRRHGVPFEQSDWLQQAVRAILRKQAWLWNSRQVEWASNEMEVWHAGRLLRFDRVVRRKLPDPATASAWWIVDYKSALQPSRSSAYREQVADYKRALACALAVDASSIQACLVGADGEMAVIL